MMKNIRYKSIVVRSEANNPTMRAKTKLEKKAGNKETKQVCTCDAVLLIVHNLRSFC